MAQVDEEDEEEQADGGVSLRVWKKYFTAGGNACRLISLVLMLFLSQVVTSGCDYFVNYFTQQEDLRIKKDQTTLTTAQCLYIYGTLIVAVIIVSIYRFLSKFVIQKLISFRFASYVATCSSTFVCAPLRFCTIKCSAVF